MEDEARVRAALEEQIKSEDREQIAEREEHEATLLRVIDVLKDGRYFRPGEEAKLVFPQPGELGSPWRKQDRSWRPGFGRAVAKCETTALIKPSVDQERDERYGKIDHLEKELRAAGYLVDVWPDYEGGSAEVDRCDYYIFEMVK